MRSKAHYLLLPGSSCRRRLVACPDGFLRFSQASGGTTVMYLKPRAVYADPFRAGNHVLVLCDVHSPPGVQDDGGLGAASPHASNNRAPAAAVLAAAAGVDPSFSVEQQYMLLDPATRWPLGEQLFCMFYGQLVHFLVAGKPQALCGAAVRAAGPVTRWLPSEVVSHAVVFKLGEAIHQSQLWLRPDGTRLWQASIEAAPGSQHRECWCITGICSAICHVHCILNCRLASAAGQQRGGRAEMAAIAESAAFAGILLQRRAWACGGAAVWRSSHARMSTCRHRHHRLAAHFCCALRLGYCTSSPLILILWQQSKACSGPACPMAVASQLLTGACSRQ